MRDQLRHEHHRPRFARGSGQAFSQCTAAESGGGGVSAGGAEAATPHAEPKQLERRDAVICAQAKMSMFMLAGHQIEEMLS
eukprot:6208325-Pleurochrysis_carterae.AAC.4